MTSRSRKTRFEIAGIIADDVSPGLARIRFVVSKHLHPKISGVIVYDARKLKIMTCISREPFSGRVIRRVMQSLSDEQKAQVVAIAIRGRI